MLSSLLQNATLFSTDYEFFPVVKDILKSVLFHIVQKAIGFITTGSKENQNHTSAQKVMFRGGIVIVNRMKKNFGDKLFPKYGACT